MDERIKTFPENERHKIMYYCEESFLYRFQLL